MTKSVNVGGVVIGGGAPVSIQSMTNVDTRDVKALVHQIDELADAGCEDAIETRKKLGYVLK